MFKKLKEILEALYNGFNKKPIIKNNTFIVWEPCSKSHSEVVPGYVKYLLDLGYHVSVIVHSDRLKEGLFSRFKHSSLSLNKMSRKDVFKYLKKSDLSEISGILITTVGKICDEIHFEDAYKIFNKNADKSKILFVSHEAKFAVDNGTWREKNITLRKLNYKDARSVVVNPHYFGDVKVTGKNEVTNFITIGALRAKRKNSNFIINAVQELYKKGITNFKVTVVGKGELKHLPKEIRKYFDIKGHLSFDEMYEEIEKADFMLTAYDENNPAHIRYNTTGTSGNFQLVYGFLKPCIITKGFAEINGFTDRNSIIYKRNEDYCNAMKTAINLTQDEYFNLQNDLQNYANNLYQTSLNNLKDLING